MYKTFRLKKELNINYKKQPEIFLDPVTITIKTQKPEVKLNQRVTKDTIIENQGLPIYSPVSGTIISINNQEVTIKNDFTETYESAKKLCKKQTYEKETIITKLIKLGFNNVELMRNLTKENKNIVINGIDDIPYILNRQQYLINKYEQILEIIEIIYDTFKPENLFFIIKNTDNTIIEKYNNSVGSYPFINYRYLNDEYPISYKEIICEKISLIPEETIIITIEELLEIYQIIKRQKPLDEKYISIIIENEESFILNTKLGTSLKNIIEKYNLNINTKKIYINNILNRQEIDVDDIIVTKDLEAIYILEYPHFQIESCIRCGTCNRVCPFGINPLDSEELKSCRNCGLCTYNCPAKIILGRGGEHAQ